MRYRTIAGVVSLLLCSLACGFLNGEAEPEVSAPAAAPAETAAEPAPEPIASASARTVILNHTVWPKGLVAFGCYDDGKWFAANQCPAKGTAVSIAAAEPGKLLLETSQAEFEPASEPDFSDEPYTTRRLVAQQQKTTREVATITAIPATHKTYVKLVGEAIGQEHPGIEQLFKIDLDADGSDEVLFSATFEQALNNMSAEVVQKSPECCDWANVGVRRVVGGEVQTTMLVNTGGRIRSLHQASIVGFTDVDGDGVLEIVTWEQQHQPHAYRIFKLDGDTLTNLGGLSVPEWWDPT